jgi:hypothetical protein
MYLSGLELRLQYCLRNLRIACKAVQELKLWTQGTMGGGGVITKKALHCNRVFPTKSIKNINF